MILRALNTVARNTLLLTAAVVMDVLSVAIMFQKTGSLKEQYGDFDPPDLWWGCSSNELYEYLEAIGVGGRKAYQDMNRWDFFPYMESYTILLGSLLLINTKNAGNKVPNDIALLFPFVMVCDVLESGIFGYATSQYPEHRISDTLITVASIANQMKWTGFLLGLVLIVGLFVNNNLVSGKKKSQ